MNDDYKQDYKQDSIYKQEGCQNRIIKEWIIKKRMNIQIDSKQMKWMSPCRDATRTRKKQSELFSPTSIFNWQQWIYLNQNLYMNKKYFLQKFQIQVFDRNHNIKLGRHLMEIDHYHPLLSDFFGCMFAGDIITKKLGTRTIFLVGQSRIGKSTLFNYILGNQLTPRRINKITVAYESQYQADGEIGHGFNSVTLLPNIQSQISYGEACHDECIADMAGFNDRNRDFVGKFAVSYMLKIVFEKIDESKIILVTDHAALFPDIPESIAKPFINFIEMLNVEYLAKREPEFLEAFFSSVAVVVTKAQDEEEYYQAKIQLVLENLKEGESNKNKILFAFLKSILKNESLEIFQKAKEGKTPPNCTIIDSLNSKNWTYFNYKDRVPSKYIYQLPFSKEYEIMPQPQKESYKTTDESKNQQIENSFGILNQFISLAISNWNNKNGDIYKDVFRKISGIVSSNPYRNFDEMLEIMSEKIEFQEEVQAKTGLAMIKSIEDIAKSIEAIDSIHSKTIDSNLKLKEMEQPLRILHNHFKHTFCMTKQQEKDFLVFMFMNVRALHQCAMMNEIDGSLGACAIFKISDGCQKIMPMSIHDIKAKFFVEYNPSLQERVDFSDMSSSFLSNEIKEVTKMAGENISNKLQLKQIQILIQKGQYCKQNQDYEQAVHEFIKALQNLSQFKATIQETQLEIDAKTQRYIEFRNRHLMELIGLCLQNIEGVEHLAERVYKEIRAVSLRDKYYRRILNSGINMEKRYNTMKDYASFSLQIGLREQAIKIYQQIIDIFVFKPKKIKQQIEPELIKCLTADQNNVKAYKEYLVNPKQIAFDKEFIENLKVELITFGNNEQVQENYEELFEKQEREEPKEEEGV